MELWSDEYFQDLVNRKIKYEIETRFYAKFKRKPTYEEYHEWFNKFISNAKCVVFNADLGIFDDDTKWYEKYEP